MKLLKLTLCSLLAVVVLAGCDGDDGASGINGSNGTNGTDGTNGADGSAGVPTLVTVDDVLKTNANIAYASYSDSLISAIMLKSAIEDLIAAPSVETHKRAKEAWLTSREPYGQTEVYRFRNGPIDNDDGREGQINAWPLAEAIIDYVANSVNGDSGFGSDTTAAIAGNIITDTTSFPSITKATLEANFELGGDESNVTTGYHAIEFLLWGQDLNADGSGSDARDASAGQRPVSDYFSVDNGNVGACTSGFDASDDSICERRGDYLLAATDLLIDDLADLVAAWNPSALGNHYQVFIAGGDTSLANILEGMGRLGSGELAGERISQALLADSQEDEHSCFSDNTHRDIFLNAKGVQNAFLGDYQRIDGSVISGAGIDDLLLTQGETALENALRAALEKTMISIAVIDQEAKSGVPFDNQIQMADKKLQIQAAIFNLAGSDQQTDVIEDVIQALGVVTGDLYQDTDIVFD